MRRSMVPQFLNHVSTLLIKSFEITLFGAFFFVQVASAALTHRSHHALFKLSTIRHTLQDTPAGQALTRKMIGRTLNGSDDYVQLEKELIRLDIQLWKAGEETVLSRLNTLVEQTNDSTHGINDSADEIRISQIAEDLLSLEEVKNSWHPAKEKNTANFIDYPERFGLGHIDGTESYPNAIQTMLFEEQVLHIKNLGTFKFSTDMNPDYLPEARPKFQIGYYLIPENRANFLKVPTMDPQITQQITFVRSGKTYYKLFVHPESHSHYAFLDGVYEFIAPEASEFIASPTMSYRSLVVWSQDASIKPFIAKVSLDRDVISIDRLVSENEVLRSVGNQGILDEIGKPYLHAAGLDVFPESSGLTLKLEALSGYPKKVGGQLIREIPEPVQKGQVRWIALASLMSPNNGEFPLIVKMLGQSQMDSQTFIRTILIQGYLKMFEKISFQRGMNFEPHSQNLLIETTLDLVPTGRWVLRDFGGVWPDALTLIQSEIPLDSFMRSDNANIYKFREGRSNSINSYVFFYRRQVFDPLIAQMAKYDPTLTKEVIRHLRTKLDKGYLRLLDKYLGIVSKLAPTLENMRNFGAHIYKHSKFNPTSSLLEVASSSRDAALNFARLKRQNGEWVKFRQWSDKEDVRWYFGPDALLAVEDKDVVGYTVFSEKGSQRLFESSRTKRKRQEESREISENHRHVSRRAS